MQRKETNECGPLGISERCLAAVPSQFDGGASEAVCSFIKIPHTVDNAVKQRDGLHRAVSQDSLTAEEEPGWLSFFP
jgi:hypothetical protein